MVKKLMQEVDDNGDQKIDFKEFKKMLSMLSDKQKS